LCTSRRVLIAYILKICSILEHYVHYWMSLEGSSQLSLEYDFFWAHQPPVGQGPLIHEGSRSHSDTHSIGLLWTSDQPETSTCQHSTLTPDIHAPGGIRTHNLSRRAVADPRLRPRGHRGQLQCD